MPLSEQEQRLLDEMERNLHRDESDIVDTSAGPRTVDYSRVALGMLVLVAGLVGIVVAVAVNMPLIGVLGFGVAVVGAMIALSANRPGPAPDEADTRPGAKQRRPRRQGFMDSLSESWDERHRRDPDEG